MIYIKTNWTVYVIANFVLKSLKLPLLHFMACSASRSSWKLFTASNMFSLWIFFKLAPFNWPSAPPSLLGHWRTASSLNEAFTPIFHCLHAIWNPHIHTHMNTHVPFISALSSLTPHANIWPEETERLCKEPQDLSNKASFPFLKSPRLISLRGLYIGLQH